ncbi:hypothetical protein EBZ80_18700 [bacterium]|nr:hypothetical protein [bacterium]
MKTATKAEKQGKVETAYTRFYRARRLALLAEDPSLSFGRLSSLISTEWRSQRTNAPTTSDVWAFLQQPCAWPTERYACSAPPPAPLATGANADRERCSIRMPKDTANGWRKEALAQMDERRRAIWVTPQEMLRGFMARRRTPTDRHAIMATMTPSDDATEDADEPVVVSTLSLSGSSSTSSDECSSSDDDDDSLDSTDDSESVASSSSISAVVEEDDLSVTTAIGDDEDALALEDDVVEDLEPDDGVSDMAW